MSAAENEYAAKAVSYGYDTGNRRTKMIDAEAVDVVYSYDAASRLTLVTEGGNTRGAYYYNAAGARTKLLYGNSSFAEYLYDGAGRLTLLANNKSDDTDISAFAYLLDAAGVRTKMSISGTAYTSADVAYLYDGAYQLTKETRTGGNAYTQSFWYDSAGNRTKKLLDAATTQYYYDYIDRMTKCGTTAIGWDYWGNMTSVWNHTYAWDDADRLTKFDRVEGPTAYDATYSYLPGSWKRYKRTQDTTVEYYVYDGDNVVGSYASNGTLNARYVTPGLDDNLSEARGGSVYYYMQDGLGSVRNLLDSSETMQNAYDYYAFGDSLGSQTQGVTNPYRYTSREYESGGILSQHFYRNRFYLPYLGLFASRANA